MVAYGYREMFSPNPSSLSVVSSSSVETESVSTWDRQTKVSVHSLHLGRFFVFFFFVFFFSNINLLPPNTVCNCRDEELPPPEIQGSKERCKGG